MLTRHFRPLRCENLVAYGIQVDGGFAEFPGVKAGADVLMFGAGPTGQVLAQLLKMNGAALGSSAQTRPCFKAEASRPWTGFT